ncbi:DUF2180 family protein [Streptomyces wuyuanensis]|uniref:DUF2180 family protein n=1 Tax=Streptomyces wuyuanensis TaxID=1196353 RepID=UPI00371AC175
MNCFECSRDAGTATPAEAVCRSCGAGLCATHVRVESREVQHRRAGLGKRTQEQPARRLLCPACEKAEHSEHSK